VTAQWTVRLGTGISAGIWLRLALIPVTVSNSEDEKREPEAVAPARGGAIHIELPDRAVISVERGADAVLLRSILESLGQ
jgi:transposase